MKKIYSLVILIILSSLTPIFASDHEIEIKHGWKFMLGVNTLDGLSNYAHRIGGTSGRNILPMMETGYSAHIKLNRNIFIQPESSLSVLSQRLEASSTNSERFRLRRYNGMVYWGLGSYIGSHFHINDKISLILGIGPYLNINLFDWLDGTLPQSDDDYISDIDDDYEYADTRLYSDSDNEPYINKHNPKYVDFGVAATFGVHYKNHQFAIVFNQNLNKTYGKIKEIRSQQFKLAYIYFFELDF